MSRRPFPYLKLVIAIIGAALLMLTVERVGGWRAIVDAVGNVGWWFAVVVAIGAFRMACRTRAWLICVNDPRLRFKEAFGAWLAADAMGNLTPLGLLASEPLKMMMVRAKISTVTSIASVTIENLFYTVSVLVVLLTGTWLFLQRANVPPGLEHLSELIVVAVAIAAVIGVWALRARPALLSKFGPLISKMIGKADAPAEAMRDVEAQIYDVPRWPLSRLTRVVLWEVAFHVGAVAETWLVLRLLVPDITLEEAFLLESAGRFVIVAFKFVPYRLGVDEVGSGAVANALGLPPAAGVSLALVRRLRILVLNAFGLIPLVSSKR